MGRRHTRYACLQGNEDWKEANLLALNGDDAVFYSRMRSAILQYRSEGSIADIRKSTGVQRSHLVYWLKRCSTLDEEGRPLLWRALTRHQRLGERSDNLEKLNRESPVSGVLNVLFKIIPLLLINMIRLVLENKAPGSDTQNKRMGWPERHEYFLDALAKANHRPPAWPYNSSDKGDRKSTRLNSSHPRLSRMPSSA